ncbi:hypothetical protein OPV22_025889 [Ensete ventricosum]|uniref:Uncharacterized protein n=1 Tax=Ensete ventricosum TaxID=4639 RepID=A0AAV8Q8N3_ENSVE|nr:hypothetical protein OPV22_025889 [Ensete ventricosum]
MKNAYLHVRYRGSIRRSRRCHVLRLGYRSNGQDLRTPALRIPRRPPSGRHPIRQDTWPTAAAPSCRGDRGRPPRSTRRSGQEHHLADSPCFPGVTAKAYPTSSSVPFSCFADLVAPSSVSHSIEPQCGSGIRGFDKASLRRLCICLLLLRCRIWGRQPLFPPALTPSLIVKLPSLDRSMVLGGG